MAKKTLASLQDRAGIPHFSDGSLKGLLRSMDAAGIDTSVVSRITTRPDQVKSILAWLVKIRRKRVIPMATWHPGLKVPPGLMSEFRNQGFKCIKLHPDYQDFFVDEERMFPFYEAAQDAGMPILFHAGLDQGLPPPLHAPPERLLAVHRTFPELKIIAAHMGGEDNYEETEKFLLGRDIYLDTSFVLRVMPKDILERFLKKHPIERVLFGSDSPWKDQSLEIEYLFSLPFLNDDEKEKIAGRNAAKLLRLD